MDERDFDDWAAKHVLATGANAGQLLPVLEANRHTFANLNATYEEINECSQMILDSGQIPDWPDKHITALVNNLHSLRAERQKRKLAGTYGGGLYSYKHDDGCDCPTCNGGEILPSYEAKAGALKAKRKELQDYIESHGGKLIADRVKLPRKGKK